MIVLSEYLKAHVRYVAAYIGTASDSWPVIKKHIVVSIDGRKRRGLGFSQRHRCTKKLVLNEFDKAVMNYWHELTGVLPVIPPEMFHDPHWVQRPKGWALNNGKEKWLAASQQQGTNTHHDSQV